MALSTFFCAYVITNITDGYMADKHGGDKVIFYSAFDRILLSTVFCLLKQWLLFKCDSCYCMPFFDWYFSRSIFPINNINFLKTYACLWKITSLCFCTVWLSTWFDIYRSPWTHDYWIVWMVSSLCFIRNVLSNVDFVGAVFKENVIFK